MGGRGRGRTRDGHSSRCKLPILVLVVLGGGFKGGSLCFLRKGKGRRGVNAFSSCRGPHWAAVDKAGVESRKAI